VSVVFEAEVGLQLLQARSLARWAPAGALREVVVIDNCRGGLDPAVLAELRRSYGPHAGVLRVLRASEVAAVPAAMGWRRQQVLKLLVAHRLASPRYVLLDAKNHLVGPWSPEAFVGPDGRMRARAYSYEQHPLRRDLEHVLRYLGLDPAPHLRRFTATVTPFVLDVATVRSLVADLEERSGRSFAQEFVRNDLTEFFLVAGWLVARGRALEEEYSLDLDTGPTLWPRAVTAAGVEEAVATARESMMFAVHRRALAALDPPLARPVAALWAERDLFPSVADAEEFVVAYRSELERQGRRQRRRSCRCASSPPLGPPGAGSARG
jgi:hypothetical protein